MDLPKHCATNAVATLAARKNPNHAGTLFKSSHDSLDHICRKQSLTMLRNKGACGQAVVDASLQGLTELRKLLTPLIRYFNSGVSTLFRFFKPKQLLQICCHQCKLFPVDAFQQLANEMNTATLPGHALKAPADRRLNPAMGIRYHQLQSA